MVSKDAVRGVGIERCQSRIEAEPCRAVGTEERVRRAHIDVDVRVVRRRGHADALEFPHPDADFRDAAVVPELQIAAAGHRLRARKNRARCRPGDRYCSKVRRCSLAKATNSRMLLARRPSSRPLEYGAVPWRSDRSSSMSLVGTSHPTRLSRMSEIDSQSPIPHPPLPPLLPSTNLPPPPAAPT